MWKKALGAKFLKDDLWNNRLKFDQYIDHYRSKLCQLFVKKIKSIQSVGDKEWKTVELLAWWFQILTAAVKTHVGLPS